MNQKWMILIAILIVGITAYLLLQKKEGQGIKAKEGPVIIFGDSLVYGIGATKGNTIAELLTKRLGVLVMGVGRPGDTAQGAQERLVSEVLVHDPGIVVLIIGGNDLLRRIPKTETLANVRTIITQIQATGASVVLVGISTMVYNQDYQAIAKELHTPFVPRLLDKTIGHAELMSDSVHPNDAGYALFADELEPVIRKLLP